MKKFFGKVWGAINDPRVALWFCGFFVACGADSLHDGQWGMAALYFAFAGLDATSLRRLQVVAA